MAGLEDYVQFCGRGQIDSILTLGEALEGQSIVHVNSTYYGGGVAEMLNRYVPLMNEAGVDMDWRLLKGNDEFFAFTKRIHNALQGADIKITDEDMQVYEETILHNSLFTHLEGYDAVIIDDPQPAGLINHYHRKVPGIFKPLPSLLRLDRLRKKQPWIWRGHIDLGNPNPEAAKFLSQYVSKYDSLILSHSSYSIPGIRKPTFLIPPAIDPLSKKNMPMKEKEIDRLLAAHGISCDKPIVCQVSRFDPWKDPLGVLEVFRQVRKKRDCQLVLLGNFATDDSQGAEIYRQVATAAEKVPDAHVLSVDSEVLVNAMQRRSDVIIQKSLREGFGLTVSEAMWKGTPVVASNVGGIPLQIEDGVSGYLVNNGQECAQRVLKLLSDRKNAKRMGKAARERVREKFLMTRLVHEELACLVSMLRGKPSFGIGELSTLVRMPFVGASMAVGTMVSLSRGFEKLAFEKKKVENKK